MLYAATKLCGLEGKYGEDDLLEWSGDIGSDISFFFSSGTAYCTGRGEIVEDMPPALPDSYPIVLIKPMRPLSTAAVYKKLDVTKCSQVDPEELKNDFYMDVLQKSNARERYPAQDLCLNDLETPAFQEMPILAQAKEELIGSGLYSSVFMSGSGSTMVCLGSHALDEAPRFEEESGDDWLAVMTQPVSRTKGSGEWYKKSLVIDSIHDLPEADKFIEKDE